MANISPTPGTKRELNEELKLWNSIFKMSRNIPSGHFDLFLAQPRNVLFIASTRKLHPADLVHASAAGTTAQATTHRAAIASGAIRNTDLFAVSGITGSFSANFRKSAKLCKRPQGPTTFGPRRNCTAAQTLRSNSRMNGSHRRCSDSGRC